MLAKSRSRAEASWTRWRRGERSRPSCSPWTRAKKRYSNLLPGVEVGGILLDSCSDLATSLHMLGRFESCELPSEELVLGPGGEEDPAFFFGPVQVIGYVLQDDFDRASVLRDTVRGPEQDGDDQLCARDEGRRDVSGVSPEADRRRHFESVLGVRLEPRPHPDLGGGRVHGHGGVLRGRGRVSGCVRGQVPPDDPRGQQRPEGGRDPLRRLLHLRARHPLPVPRRRSPRCSGTERWAGWRGLGSSP